MLKKEAEGKKPNYILVGPQTYVKLKAEAETLYGSLPYGLFIENRLCQPSVEVKEGKIYWGYNEPTKWVHSKDVELNFPNDDVPF